MNYKIVTSPSVQSPPLIIKQPVTEEMLFQVASYGDTEKPLIIECEAEGEPAPKYVKSRVVKNHICKYPWRILTTLVKSY